MKNQIIDNEPNEEHPAWVTTAVFLLLMLALLGVISMPMFALLLSDRADFIIK